MLKTRETRVEERKEEKRSEKRDRILRAAEAIFLDKGFHAASMNERNRRSGQRQYASSLQLLC
ncbi:hypothetical protein [Parasutterella excrementihominis]|uniref:hypothetical protein n=1 Tax=Parasutterella excrementihominis TaxID=487175 RepID=UPI002665D1F8|nr:hypothetical protein [Parasutterella excrementihominis]